ncbi:MFS transporter [Bacillus sp. Marseille-P3661]|uniref:MFS transporter n=1 Tax=Bacillus sp. Marseille-P3661 TaxID=1936234 RepID=UPI0015E1B4F1|nr:MFS transporter [Bacillus sp. Marseille-P3661]
MANDSYKNKKFVLFTTCLGAGVVTLNNGSLNIAIPTMVNELHTSLETASWIITSFMISTTLFLLFAGKLSDQLGRKKTYMTGLTFFMASALFAGFMNSVEWLIVARIIQGIGGAIILSNTIPIVTDIFADDNNLGKNLGIVAMSLAIGAVCGPIIGGFLLLFSWHFIFWFNVPIFLFILVSVFFNFPQQPSSFNYKKIDFRGTFVLLLFLISILFTLTYALPSNWGALSIMSLLLLSFVCLIVFILVENKAEDPIIQTDLFKNRIYSIANIATFTNSFAQSAIMFVMVIFLQSLKGMHPFTASLLLIPMPLLLAISGPISGKLADRFGSKLLSIIGIFLVTIGSFLLGLVQIESSIFYILFALAVIGLGSGVFQAPNTKAIMNIATPEHRGVVAATRSILNTFGRLIAVSISVGVLGTVLPVEGMALAEESYSALLFLIQSIFWGTAFVSLLTSALYWRPKKKKINMTA